MKHLITLSILFLVTTGIAQNPDKVIDNYIKALGGADKLASVKSIHKKDTMIANGMSLPMETYQDTTGKIYSSTEMAGQKIILVAFDGEKGFVFDNTTFGYKDISQDQAESFRNKAKNIFGYFYNYKKEGHTLKYKGKEVKNGKNMEVLEMHLKEPVEGDIQDLTAYFDTDTHLLSMIEIEKDGNLIVTHVENYKPYSGILFPVEITTKLNGNTAMILKNADVTINPPAPSADKFVKPNN
jgi:hypothetical protein